MQKPVFEGVAQEVLAECVTSLQFASTALLKKKVCEPSVDPRFCFFLFFLLLVVIWNAVVMSVTV